MSALEEKVVIQPAEALRATPTDEHTADLQSSEMPAPDRPLETTAIESHGAEQGATLLAPLLYSATASSRPIADMNGVFVGELLALDSAQCSALVRCVEIDRTQVLRARSTVDLHGAHIGQEVTLVFERGSVDRPIVVGVLRGQPGWPLPEQPAQVQADGERLIVSAKEQLVLRCGKASITLTKAGKVLIEGTYVSSRSSGVNRVKGGSVHIN